MAARLKKNRENSEWKKENFFFALTVLQSECSLKTAYMKYNKTSNIQNNFFRYEMNQNNKSIRRYVYILAGQANKSIGWMPWHQEPKKDAVNCEKPWGAVSKHRSMDIRMRELIQTRAGYHAMNT